jgi:hypothetical protein
MFISGEAAGEAVEMQIRTDDDQSKKQRNKDIRGKANHVQRIAHQNG